MRITEAAQMLGVSVQTLRNWERLGKIPDHKGGLSGQRHYSKADILYIKGLMGHGPSRSYNNTTFKAPTSAKQTPISVTLPPKPDLRVDWDAVERLNEKELWAWFSTQPNQMELVRAAPNERLSSDLAYMLSQGHQLPDADMALHPGIAYPSGGD